MVAKLFTAFFLILFTAGVQATPHIQQWETGNGTRVFYVHAPELPMVDFRVWFNAGAARDGTQPGLALLTNALMPEGAGSLDANALAEKFDAIGARFGNDSQRDVSEFTLRSLSDKAILDQAVSLLSLILTRPSFPEEAFNREKNRLAIALKGQKQSPDSIADRAFYHAVYGDHPYGSMPEGDEDTIAKINREHLQAFHKKYYVGANAIIAIVGDISKDRAAAIAEQLTGKLPKGEAAGTIPNISKASAPGLQRIEHPSTQSHVLMGQPGVRRGDEDYFALYLGNHILGGSGLISRISEEIREKRGLSYSSYSYFLPMQANGPFILGLQTAVKSTDEALSVLKETLKEFIEKGPTPAELEAAKKNITGGFPLRVSSNSKIVEYVAMIGFYNLPLTYLDEFMDRINAVTLEQVKDAFRRRVNPEQMSVIIVGAQGEREEKG